MKARSGRGDEEAARRAVVVLMALMGAMMINKVLCGCVAED